MLKDAYFLRKLKSLDTSIVRKNIKLVGFPYSFVFPQVLNNMLGHRAKPKPNKISKTVQVCKVYEYLLIVISCYFVPLSECVH